MMRVEYPTPVGTIIPLKNIKRGEVFRFLEAAVKPKVLSYYHPCMAVATSTGMGFTALSGGCSGDLWMVDPFSESQVEVMDAKLTLTTLLPDANHPRK